MNRRNRGSAACSALRCRISELNLPVIACYRQAIVKMAPRTQTSDPRRGFRSGGRCPLQIARFGATANNGHDAHRHSGKARRQKRLTGWKRSATNSINAPLDPSLILHRCKAAGHTSLGNTMVFFLNPGPTRNQIDNSRSKNDRYRRNATRRSSVETSPPLSHSCSRLPRSSANICASRVIKEATN